MAKVDRLVTQAMLHPEIAQQLLGPVLSGREASTIGQRLAAQLGAAATTAKTTPVYKTPLGMCAATMRPSTMSSGPRPGMCSRPGNRSAP
jgi:hypothetical protein